MTQPPLRKIALLDLDAFFAAVEITKNPQLAKVPFAVGGGGERGVVATCNYLARQFGVRSAMSGFQALRLCPQLVFVKPDMPSYKAMSKQVLEIIHKYTPIVEPASIDEFYLDLSDVTLLHGSATLIMEAIRTDLRALGITGSAGISNQKMVAKIASDENKPDGQRVVPPEQVYAYIAQLPLGRIPGVGPKSEQRLAHAGLYKGADIQAADVAFVQSIVGESSGFLLHQRCQGIDPRPINTHRIRKQISVEDTFPRDIKTRTEAEHILAQQLLPALRKRLPSDQWQDTRIRTQTVKLKFSDFQQTTVSRAANKVSPSLFYQLLNEAWQRKGERSVRLIGVGVTLPDPDENRQLELDLD
ncbi:DNA polymerase IV [Aliidiomarina taiwanensis]|uniref:DNA polymerase IV n=1 Tax=Aliidiomarina taiwanensis TaxID=946228 RepID=A0A432WVP4_9GAMM|nr:DNA polymerase IV [Aliidiomarina taiwanensis]RUO37838.1 DNA polymerase IV [Aliidiomarina taiwanensis]